MTRVHFNVSLVLQSCTDPLQVLPGSSCGTFPTLSEGTYGVGSMKFDIDIKEEEEVNVKTEKEIGSGEEKCVDIKDKKSLHREEEDMDLQEEENIEIKEEVRMRIQCNML
jgi:hypothetical protein